MRERVLLWVSLVLNVAMAAMLVALSRIYAPKPEIPVVERHPAEAQVVKTNVVVRRQNFVWNQIESDDYPTYIANLRAIGCPESTIRDIIVADVNQVFTRRRATEVVTAEQQWWRSEPDPGVTQAAAAKLKALDDERRGLLSKLLGPDWESSYYPYPQLPGGSALDGPILGALSPEVKHAIHELETRASERRQAYLDAAREDGKPPDPAELEQVRQQMRSELAQLLGPQQLEEYLLRYSTSASQLRNELRGLDTNAEEFRKLFHARDAIEQQLQALAGSDDPASVKRKQELESQRDTEIKQVLGKERYQEYRLNQDPLFRDSRALVQQAGAPLEKLLPLYEINHATEVEQQRIRGDATLSPEQRIVALQSVRASHEIALRKLLGEEAYQRYLQTHKE